MDKLKDHTFIRIQMTITKTETNGQHNEGRFNKKNEIQCDHLISKHPNNRFTNKKGKEAT